MNKQWMASIAGVLILTLVALGAPLAAQDAPDEDPIQIKVNKEWEALDPKMRAAVDRMMVVSGTKKMLAQVFQAIPDQVDQMIRAKEAELGMSDPRFGELARRHIDRIGATLLNNYDEWVLPMKIAFAHHYTLKEIRELISFHESPVGQKTQEIMPKLMADGMEGMMPVMMKHMEKVNKELKNDLDALMDEIAAEGGNESRYSDLEAEAAWSVRLTIVCAITYHVNHSSKGYPGTLSSMGPDGDNCLDEQLASGVFNGYRFEYQPTDAVGELNTDFAITAIPINYGDLSKQSFFADATGIIRFTEENRPATENDPPI